MTRLIKIVRLTGNRRISCVHLPTLAMMIYPVNDIRLVNNHSHERAMSQKNRRPERRLGADQAETNSDLISHDRRSAPERQRHGCISEIELCRGSDCAKIEHILERYPRRELVAREPLLEPGQADQHIYFLLEGRLDVRLQSPDLPAVDEINVGEMSIIDGLPTSAYVIATEPSMLIAVHESIFWSKIATNPSVIRNLTRVLAERMRKCNDATLRAVEKEFRLEQLQKDLLAAYEIQTGILPMLLSNDGQSFVPVDDSQGLISGVLAENEYSTASARLVPGDRLLLYTDGVTEARDVEPNFTVDSA